MMVQIVAAAIFLVMFILIISGKVERHYVTLGCGAATLILVFGLGMHSLAAIDRTLNLESIFTLSFWYTGGAESAASGGINWQTIIFIAGMMIMVQGMSRAGFFNWLCMWIAKLVHYRVIPIFITFMVLSFALSMFIDSITVILFLAAITIELARLLNFPPVPMILAEVFCANLGGSATMCGDPPNIIIGTALGYSFADFVLNTGLIAVVCLVLCVIYFYFIFRKELLANANQNPPENAPRPEDMITGKRRFIASCMIFGLAVVLLVTHAQTGLTVATIGAVVALLTIIVAKRKAFEVVRRIDIPTLLFFVGLFIVVSGLEETGVLTLLADFIGNASGGNLAIMVAIILWISAFASAFIDNIPFAATMIPVIQNLAAVEGVPLTTLAWTLAIGTDVGGSATPIGASANVVGVSTATSRGYKIGWGKYCLAMVPATVMVVAVANLVIYARYL